MPIYEIWHQATSSRAAATTFMVLLLIAALVALTAVQQTASRLTWSLGRDDALLGSARFLSVIHPTLHVPVYALVLNNTVVFLIGFVFLGSSTAFNSFIATGLILQQTTYAIPAALLMRVRWRDMRRPHGELNPVLPANRAFQLPAVVGWTANAATVLFAVIVVVFYNFPVVVPVSGSNMSESLSPLRRLLFSSNHLVCVSS